MPSWLKFKNGTSPEIELEDKDGCQISSAYGKNGRFTHILTSRDVFDKIRELPNYRLLSLRKPKNYDRTEVVDINYDYPVVISPPGEPDNTIIYPAVKKQP